MQADESSWAAKEAMQQEEDSKAERQQGGRRAMQGDGERPPSVLQPHERAAAQAQSARVRQSQKEAQERGERAFEEARRLAAAKAPREEQDGGRQAAEEARARLGEAYEEVEEVRRHAAERERATTRESQHRT